MHRQWRDLTAELLHLRWRHNVIIMWNNLPLVTTEFEAKPKTYGSGRTLRDFYASEVTRCHNPKNNSRYYCNQSAVNVLFINSTNQAQLTTRILDAGWMGLVSVETGTSWSFTVARSCCCNASNSPIIWARRGVELGRSESRRTLSRRNSHSVIPRAALRNDAGMPASPASLHGLRQAYNDHIQRLQSYP